LAKFFWFYKKEKRKFEHWVCSATLWVMVDEVANTTQQEWGGITFPDNFFGYATIPP